MHYNFKRQKTIFCLSWLNFQWWFIFMQNGESCFCGNHFGKHGASSDSECNKPCNGDSKENCGANWRNSIYSGQLKKIFCFILSWFDETFLILVNHVPGLRLTFDKIFHCKSGSDMFGYCKRNKCFPGWKGDKCEQRGLSHFFILLLKNMRSCSFIVFCKLKWNIMSTRWN